MRRPACSPVTRVLAQAIISCALAGAFSGAAYAQGAQGAAAAYPTRPVTIIIPYSPGSSTEPEVRLYAQKMSEYLGQPFTVDFKGGAGSTLGTAFVAKSAPDGYTLLQVSSAIVIAPLLYKNLTYEPLRDFIPLSQMSKKANVIVVAPSFPAKNLQEFIAYARANPEKVNFGTSGAGGPQHLAAAWLHSATNTRVTFIHYKGGSPGFADLMAGRIDVLTNPLAASIPNIKAGKFRALAVTSQERTSLLPDLPSVAEQDPSLKDYEYSAIIGIIAPRNVPAPVISKLSANLMKVAKSPDVVQKLAGGGAVMIGSTPEEFRKLLVNDTEWFRKLIVENNIKLEED